jgi:hypothetical protein
MKRCAGKGYEFCESCANSEVSFECDDCEDGSNFEGLDIEQELTVHELRYMTLKAA